MTSPLLPQAWTSRVPTGDDVAALVQLRRNDQEPWLHTTRVDEAAIEGEIVGPASWTRRQLVFVDPGGDIRAWTTVHDRAAGRTMVAVYVDRDLEIRDQIAAACYGWAKECAVAFADLREVNQVRLDASPFADDSVQLSWLSEAGYGRRRRWLHMERPVAADEEIPALRTGVTIRHVDKHDNGLPVASELQLVHEMLERSFEDHFNSYRESFPEFVQRLREDPGHRWDHWWLAFVDEDGVEVPAGAVVCSVIAPNEAGTSGTYVEYIGVNRAARGRGVAKGLLNTVIKDARDRGRDRVGLEVDADSPTNADQLYVSMGWATDYVTESWFRDFTA